MSEVAFRNEWDYGPDERSRALDVKPEHTKYEYPKDDRGKRLDFAPDSDLAQRVLGFIKPRLKDALSAVRPLYSQWRENDHLLTCYANPDVVQRAMKKKNEQTPIDACFGTSYEALETAMGVGSWLLCTEPILQYEEGDPRKAIQALRYEKLAMMQSSRFSNALAIRTALRDNWVYGFGAVSTIWEREVGWNRYYTPMGDVRVYETMNEGTRFVPVDPYHFLFDTAKPMCDIKHMDFVAERRLEKYNYLLELERAGDMGLFNVELTKDKTSDWLYGGDESGRYDATETRDQKNAKDTVVWIRGSYKLDEEKLGLGHRKGPQMWQIDITGSGVIIGASPMLFDHNQHPFAIMSTESDGHTPFPVSKVSITRPLQRAADFLLNLVMRAQRLGVYGRPLVDPKSIMVSSLIEGSADEPIWTAFERWGMGVQNCIDWRTFQDFTGPVFQYINQIMQWQKEIFGATDVLMGQVKQKSESPTAAEAMNAANKAQGRINSQIEVAALQFLHPLCMQSAYNTRQFMTKKSWIETDGQWDQLLRREYPGNLDPVTGNPIQGRNGKTLVEPEHLRDSLDTLMPRSQLVPRAQNIDGLERFFGLLASANGKGLYADLASLAARIGEARGVANPTALVRPMKMPDEQIKQQEQAGNLIPVGQLPMGGGGLM